MARKKNKKTVVGTISALDQFAVSKPRFNGFQTGTGVHGDTRYNRRASKREFRRALAEY